MDLRSGYKQTEVGVIPQEWTVRSLGTLATTVASGKSKVDSPFGGYAVYGSTGVIGYCERPEYAGDAILVARVGANAGKLNLVSGQYGVTDNTIIVRMSSDSCLSFFWRQLEAQRLNSLVFGSGQPLITGTQLKALHVCVPPLPEQRAIAGALGDVDALLSALTQLIAKKRDLKQAAMQQLLTGQTRLPGFSGECEVFVLGDGISLLSGHHVLAQHCNSQGDGVPYLTGPADFPNGTIQHTKFTTRPTTLCGPNDILVTVKGSGSGSLVVADAVYCISRQLVAIRVREWDRTFIYYSLLQNASHIKAASTGLIPGLSRSDILEQALPLPALPEQTAIAAVLSDIDAELATLEQRLAKTRALKQGMMQELLTGRTRLV
jgi:type I restriction enzyme S subunit